MCDEARNIDRLLAERASLRERLAQIEALIGPSAAGTAPRHPADCEDQFLALFERSATGMAITSMAGDFLRVNPTFSRFLGYTVEELVRQPMLVVTHPDDRLASVNALQNAITMGPQSLRLEKRYLRKDGTVVWAELNSSLICDTEKNPLYFFSQIVDIGERKETEKAMRRARDELEQRVSERTVELSRANESLAVFRHFAEASSQGFSMADLEGRLLYLNPAFCRMLDIPSPDHYLGQHVSVCYTEASNRLGREVVMPALLDDESWQGEMTVVSADGIEIPTWHNAFVMRGADGNLLRLAVVATDITERKQGEKALDRERQTLWHMLQASDHERRNIAYEIHDGLAQDLAAAAMHLQAYESLRIEAPAAADQAYRAALALLQQSHAGARRLISEVRPPVIDEQGLEIAITHLVHHECRRGSPEIECHISGPIPRLPLLVENAIYRVVQEAITNARKHSNAELVWVRLTVEPEQLHIEVRDQGIGFDPSGVSYTRFGLEVMRQRARLLDAHLTIDSAPDQGTCVKLIVPLT